MKMNIHELQNYAQNNGFDSVKFSFVNHKGDTINCQWLDAYLDLFKIEALDGFITVDQWVETTRDRFNLHITP